MTLAAYREKKNKLGLCHDCLKPRAPGRKLCPEHDERAVITRKARREELKKQGICPICRNNRPTDGMISCRRCIDNHVRCQKRRFFQYRAKHFNGSHKTFLTAKQLWSLWKSQRGKCALTGRKLTLEVYPEVDHIIPKSKGGTHEINNLRWVIKSINRIKRDTLDAEFIALCRDVVQNFKGSE